MNQEKLQHALHTLAESYTWFDEQTIHHFGNMLGQLSTWQTVRINPLHFATSSQLDPSTTLNFFIYATKIGLFHLEWNMVCPSCGGIEYSFCSLHELGQETFYCTICNLTLDAEIDRYVEVSFTLTPDVSEFHVDPYANYDNFFRFFFSTNFERTEEFTHYLREKSYRDFRVLTPQSTEVYTFEAKAGEMFRFLSIDQHSASYMEFSDEPEQETMITIEMTPDGFATRQFTLPPGKVTVTIYNRLSTPCGCSLLYTDFPTIHQLIQDYPHKVHPFVTGTMMLNNQKFRESFLFENLPNDLKLRISSLTILFTDLKGSTELYDRTGDFHAYNLVQEHFRLLSQVAQNYAGAIVKTMGDAVMASFSTPLDGMKAAIEMMQRMETFNRSINQGGYSMGLKLGLHTGSALAVKANETLDFFGQTVNIAARVQSIAREGEIWITDAVYENEGIEHLLVENGCYKERHSVTLKGVNRPSIVYKCAFLDQHVLLKEA